jgi:GTP-sensing pleiotropic transcriptional regulator CodY
MRIDPDECRDPDLLAAEVRRLNAAIDAGSPTLSESEREAIEQMLDEASGMAQTESWAVATLRNLLERLQ